MFFVSDSAYLPHQASLPESPACFTGNLIDTAILGRRLRSEHL
ncbi:hypothetical protein Poly51_11040 [Rubripirellula tenax]|uniref:Uncharacterized protein n=1 Tax=Rubripirellula tenax TaxID=2528015 RepID=A0A5C6FJN2_9BACT|nr:hypothetical protein Poly51_11040 [Rubripirellula tenax]